MVYPSKSSSVNIHKPKVLLASIMAAVFSLSSGGGNSDGLVIHGGSRVLAVRLNTRKWKMSDDAFFHYQDLQGKAAAELEVAKTERKSQFGLESSAEEHQSEFAQEFAPVAPWSIKQMQPQVELSHMLAGHVESEIATQKIRKDFATDYVEGQGNARGFDWIQKFTVEVQEGRVFPFAEADSDYLETLSNEKPLRFGKSWKDYQSHCHSTEECTRRMDADFEQWRKNLSFASLEPRCVMNFVTGLQVVDKKQQDKWGRVYTEQYDRENTTMADLFQQSPKNCEVALHRSLHRFIQRRLPGHISLESWDAYPTRLALTTAAENLLEDYQQNILEKYE